MTTMQPQGFLVLACLLLGYKYAAATTNLEIKTTDLVTQTVYGFLDFTTTIGKTIMIFSPQSAPSLEILTAPSKPVNIIQTKPYSAQGKSSEIYPTKSLTNVNQNKKSVVQITETARKDYLNQPDYDLLSRQPETFAEESYHVVDLVSRKKSGLKRSNTAKDRHPVGLVTTLSGKIAMDGTTTIHETSVIGTYISGKYAQVLQSNFHVLNNSHMTLSPTSVSRVLRTDSPTTRHFNAQLGRLSKNRSTEEHRVVTATVDSNTHHNRKHGNGGKPKAKGRQKNKTSKSPRHSYREPERSSSSVVSNDAKRYSFRQRLNQVLPVPPTNTSTTNVKLRPSGRWQYKSTMKPRVYIRKASDFTSSISPTQIATTINEIELNTLSSPLAEVVLQSSSVKGEDITEDQTLATTLYPVETINIDIVTPSNFEDFYYEIATIKTPYTFQMGTIKKTRYVTVTSTTEKQLQSDYLEKSSIKGPLIENILATTTPINQLLHASSITTFPACTLTDATETPSLDEHIETFTQSQLKLKTQVFPIVGLNQSTSYLTLLQTYGITTFITATKTTPGCIGNNFNEFNTRLDEAGSELNLDLEFADFENSELDGQNSSGEIVPSPVSTISNEVTSRKSQNDDQSQNYYPTFSPEQLQQLAYLKLFQQNAQIPQLPQIAQLPTPPPQEVLSTEPIYESHVIPLVKNGQTSYKTLSKLISKTDYLPAPSSQPQLLPSLNPFGLQQPQFRLVTSATVQPTVLTQTLSRILKLTFGAKTALTTIYSTNTLTTNIATYITTSLPVQPTANFFPPVFPQFPFLG